MLKGKEKKNEGECSEGFEKYCYDGSKNGSLDMDSGKGHLVGPAISPPERMVTFQTNSLSNQNFLGFLSSTDGSGSGSSGVEPQDADYCYIPPLNYELESLILARIPRSEYWKLCFVNKRCSTLLKSGELFKLRKDIGITESSVFMSAAGENNWLAFDWEFKTRRKLPNLQTDFVFTSTDKESFCAGTHLLVSGRELDGLVIWRYELAINRWYKGPSMITPRCLFASATSGTFAFVAGGVGNGKVYDTAEKYDSESKSWEPLPRMKKSRKLCSGCYMDNKFYVIGGRNEEGELTCGEFFDEAGNRWQLIPEILRDSPVLSSYSPPLIAVVNNELYSLEASSNQLKVYVKSRNTWKQLGPVPVRADFNRGWGVAFKSLGNELLVIGASSVSDAGDCMACYTCCPDPAANELHWRLLYRNRNQLSQFILNCAVMVA